MREATPKYLEFWSSAEYESVLPGLVQELRRAGVHARSLFHISRRAYRKKRGRFGRFAQRARMYVSYPIGLGLRCLLKKQPGARIVCSNTFYAPLVARMFSPKRVPVIHLVYDLFPDVLVCAGFLRRGGIVEKILQWVTAITMESATINVFLGERLRRYAEKKFPTARSCKVIPVGADGSPFRGFVPQRRRTVGVRFLYCGNLGAMHEVRTLEAWLDYMNASSSQALEFEFCGGGSGMQRLYNFARSRCLLNVVKFSDYQEGNCWVDLMRAADIAIVTLRNGAEDLVMPSKTYSAMVAGQAILAICSLKSDLADLILGHDCGWVIEPGDIQSIAELTRRISRSPEMVFTKRQNSYDVGHKFYDTRVIAESWRALVSDLNSRESPKDTTRAVVA